MKHINAQRRQLFPSFLRPFIIHATTELISPETSSRLQREESRSMFHSSQAYPTLFVTEAPLASDCQTFHPPRRPREIFSSPGSWNGECITMLSTHFSRVSRLREGPNPTATSLFGLLRSDSSSSCPNFRSMKHVTAPHADAYHRGDVPFRVSRDDRGSAARAPPRGRYIFNGPAV